MSELKMRDALITAREFLVLEGNAEDNLAIVKIDEALAQHHSAVVELTDAARYLPPRKRQEPGNTPVTARYGYVIGWNACLDAIAAHIAKQSGGAA